MCAAGQASVLPWSQVFIHCSFRYQNSQRIDLSGDFSLTAAAIARQVGIITTPDNEIKHLADLPLNTPLANIPDFDDNKAPDATLTSLVLSGSEMITMTESQWKQVLTVRKILPGAQHLLIRFVFGSSTKSCLPVLALSRNYKSCVRFKVGGAPSP